MNVLNNLSVTSFSSSKHLNLHIIGIVKLYQTVFITIFNIRIKRDFLKHKTVKTNDKIRRFGVFMTPLSRKILKRSCKLQHLKRLILRATTALNVAICMIFLIFSVIMES